MHEPSTYGNLLFPIFLKQDVGRILLVGAGPVGLEKLTALIQNIPRASITVIAMDVLPEVKMLSSQYPNIVVEQRPYSHQDLEGFYMVIAAVNNRQLSEEIAGQARQRRILVNVADTPDLCDFYLSSIVKKGNLKIAISTNGKSPTVAKRLKELLNETLPEEMDDLLEHMHRIRQKIKGDFAQKVTALNELTRSLSVNNNIES
jgi:siroheme synthase-like protein